MKKLFIFALFIVTLFSLTPFKAFADTTSTTYYVDLINGNDSNAGTSIDKALKNVEKAYEKVSTSGDTICIIGGYTFKDTTNLPPKSVKITSLSSKGIIYFRDGVSINADTVFENINLGFMYPDEDGGRAIYANGYNLTIGPGVDTNYQEGIKYPSVYGGSRLGSIFVSPNITLISGQFDTIYAGGRDNNTVTSATINLKSNGTLQLANVDASSSLNNVVINYTNSGSKISNKINAAGGIVNFIGTNTDLNYLIENASQISMISSILNIYERGNFKNSSKEKLNFSLDSNSILKIGKNGIFDINGNFDGRGTINFGPNSYLNINGKVSGQTKITQIFTASRQGIVSANLGTEDNFYLNDDSYCQIEFEQNYDSVKWNIIIPSEAPKTYYVNGTAENHGDGSSIENPLPTIEEAIANSEHGDYIYICGDTDVTGDLNIDKDITISGMENAKLNFASENLSINVIYGQIVFESNLNITGYVPNIYMEQATAILNGGEFNRIYAQDDYGSELEVKGSLINTIENIASVTMAEYGENDNFTVIPNLTNVRDLTILSSYIEFNGSLVDIKNLTVENSTINILDNTSIPGASTLGDLYENLAVKLNIASGKKLEFKSSIQLLSDISIDVIGNPDESIYLVCTEIGGFGSIKSTHPERYEFEETKDETSISYKLKRKSEYIVPVSSIKLDKSNISLEKGETEKINAVVLPENATDKTLVWESSNTDVATVDESGNVTAVFKGTTTITVSSGNVKNECIVNVTEKVIPATSIKLDKTDLSLIVGDSYTINAKVLPENATDKTLNWQSSNQEVATVDNSGNVTAVSKGTTNITVSSNNVSSNCVVNVTEKVIPATSIKLDKTDLSLIVGDSYTINAKVLPENATDKTLKWVSTNPEIATIDENGKVTAVSKGTTTITVSSNNVSSNCVVNVTEKVIPATSIKLDKTDLSLIVGDSYTINAKVLPENATNKTLKWVSTNPEIATIDENGKVTAVSKGTTTITVSSNNVSSNCIVNVTEKVIPTTSIKLDKTDLSLIVGDSYTINAVVLPENATDKTLKWVSTNPEIATIDENGNVTAVSKGTTTITVSSNNVSSNCVVNVTEKVIPATSIKLDKTDLSLIVGDSYKINAKVLPENATNKTLKWGSSNPEVATVDNNGNVTAISKGITTIMVSSYDEAIKSYCNINIYNISDAEIELSNAIEEANKVLKASNPKVQDLLKEIIKLSKAINNLNNEQ